MPVDEKPRVLITIASTILGGPGKGLLQFLRCGGMSLCDPRICSFYVDAARPWQLRDEFVAAGFPFIALRQRHNYDPLLVPEAHRLIRSERTQVLQSHGYKSHVLCLALKLRTGLPWIAFSHGWTTENLKIRLFRLLDLALLRFADRNVVVADSLRRQLVAARIDDTRIVTIRNAIESSPAASYAGTSIRDRYGSDDTTCLLGVIGRFSPEKGHTHFIEAMRRVVTDRPHVKALLVGDGQEESVLREQAARSGLTDHIVFTGYQRDVVPFLRATDILVIPSLSEGMPNVALEAMASAKPVIATRVGGVPEVVLDGKTGILVPPAQPGALADAVNSLCDDPDSVRRFGAAGLARVCAEFDPQVRARTIVTLYRELLCRG